MPIDLFSKTPLPDRIPEEMQKVIDKLKIISDKEECLRRAYTVMITRYNGNRTKTVSQLDSVFEKNIDVLWGREGFRHCTNINYMMRIILLRSGNFSEADILLRWTQIWFIFPHQYLQVRMGDRWINVDIWAKEYGIQFGDRAHGFHGKIFSQQNR